MKMKKTKLASILIGLVMALSLVPGLAVAANAGSDAPSNATGTDFAPATTGALGTNEAAISKPSQAIQAGSMTVFKTDTGKKVSAKVVEGNGAISYAVKEGSEAYIDVDASSGALTIKGVPSDNIAYVTATAAATDTYAQTSADVTIKIYDQYKYEVSFWTVQYAAYNRVYNLSSLDITLYKDGNKVGSTTVENPRNGGKATVFASDFADKVEMTAHIQIGRSAPITLTGSGGIGGSINVWNPSSYSGKVFTCNYGMNAPEPECMAPVAKTTLTANGTNQTLVYPGSVSVGGRMQYSLGNASGPGSDWSGLGCAKAKDPGTYYVWWRTHNTDYYTARYIGQGRCEMAPQCVVVTIDKGTISPTANIEGWTYGEAAKTPTVTGNTGNGAVTYEYKAKGAADDTYTTTVPTDAGDYTVRASIADTTSFSGGSATADFTIARATVPQQEVRVVGRVSSVDTPSAHWEANIMQSLAGMMPNDAGTLTYEAGAPKYADGTTTLPAGVTSFTSNVDSSGVVTARLEIPPTATDIPEGVREITLPVTVKSQKNYDDAIINVVVVPTKREEKTVTIEGVPTSSKTYGDGAFTLTATVKDGDNIVPTKEGDWYWYSSDPNVLEVPEVTEGYKASGTMPVTVKGPGSAMILAWYEPSDSDTIGAALTASITVNKAEIAPSVTLAGWTYGDTPNDSSVNGNAGNGELTYSYSGTTLGKETFGPSADAPTQAGAYTVTVTVAETDNYLGGTCTADFTIAPKSVPVTVIAEDKTYDGTTDVNVIAAMKASDLVDGDLLEGTVVYEDGTVAFPGLKGTFDDSSAGQNKEVTLDASGVAYPVADVWSYEAVISETPAASILPRPVYVKADDKSSRHGQAIAELTYSLDSSDSFSGLVGEDALASLGVTASTTASSSSNVGDYPITLSGGTANSNYNVYLVEGGTYKITQAEALTKSIRVVGLMNSVDQPSPHWETSVTQSVKNMMPSDAGTLTYTVGKPSYNKVDGTVQALPDGFTFSPTMDSSTGEVSATLQITKEAAASIDRVGEIILPVTVASQNYEDSTVNVVVVPKDKALMEVSITGVPDSVVYGDQDFTLTATVKDADGKPVTTVEGDWYWYSSDSNVLEVPEVTGEYRASGTMSVKVKNPGSAMIMAWFEPNDDTRKYIGATLTDPITVDKVAIAPSVTLAGWTYGEAPKEPVLAEGSNPGGCTVTYEYKAKDADDGAYIEDVPTQASEYTVRATVLESTYHKGGTCTADFTIAKRPVDAIVEAENKTYDGTTDANVSATVGEGVLEGDVVTVSGLSGTFADAKAGEGKTVTIDTTGVTFTGEGAANYEVAIPKATTATIEKRSVNVNADDKSSPFGQAIAKLTYSLDGSTTLAEGDTLESLGITASTTATNRSNVGEYPITLSGGTANPNYDVHFGKDGTYTITSPAYDNIFTDVKEGGYYYEAVLWAANHDPVITTGYTGTTLFGVGDACLREQAVTFLWRSAGCPEPTGSAMPFTDVHAGDYFYKAVQWAVEKGITTGYTGTTLFGVGDPCLREQAVTFLWRAADKPEPTSSAMPFTDVAADGYYHAAVMWALEKEITTGYTGTTLFGVGDLCLREQAVTFLYRAR